MEILRNNFCVTLLTIVLTLTAVERVMSIAFESEIQEDTKWKNCSLNFASIKEYHLFNKSIVEHRLIKLSINLTWLEIPINGTRNNSDIVQQRWFIATEEAGKDLLLLDNQFEIMSLGTLSIKVGKASLTLKQTPQDCIAELSDSQARETISAYVLGLVLKRHTNEEDKDNEDEINPIYVCNGTLNENGICCVLNEENIMSCMKLEENKWNLQFHIIVYILTIIIISRSISLIPESFYKDCEVRTASVKTPIKFGVTDINLTKLNFLMNASDDKIEQSEPETTKRSQDAYVLFYLEESRFESQTLQTSGFLNVFLDLLQFIDDIFCKCMYKDREEVRECCYYNIYRSCHCFNCLCWLMNVLLLFIILSPVIFRIILFYYADFENFQIELKLFIGCLANIALLIMYYILILKMGLFKNVLDKAHVHFKECMRIVMATRLQDELFTGLKLISRGFVYCARRSRRRCLIVLGLLLFISVVIPFTIIIHLLKLLVIMHPLLHFILRFPLVYLNLDLNFQTISDFIKTLKNSCTACIIFILFTAFYIVVVICLAATFFFIPIFIRTTVFYITCCLYVAIGCLLNFDNLSVYITAFVLISTYMYKCIQNVSTTTRSFKKKIIDAIIKCDIKDKYSNEISGEIQKMGKTSYLQTKHCMFYYKTDTFGKQSYMSVSKAFLEQVSSIQSNLTPGPTYWLYCKAFIEIGTLFMLLGLLTIIVVSYGNAINLSTGVKTLITLGSGALIGFLFDKFFVKSVSHSSYENKELFEDLIKDQLETGVEELWKIKLPDQNDQMDYKLCVDDIYYLDPHDSNIKNDRVSGINNESFENSESTAAKVPF